MTFPKKVLLNRKFRLIKQLASILITCTIFTNGDAQDFAWLQTEQYRAPDFESYFPDDVEGGKSLDALWNTHNDTTIPDEEILKTVRLGLRRTVHHRTSIIRWIGNRYIWGKPAQNPSAIELMYHAADFKGENADPYGTRHYAVYFGLSVVQPKTPAILRTLADLCMRVDDPNDLGRVAWGTKSQQEELIGFLEPYLTSDDDQVRAKAHICREIFLGERKAFEWAIQQAKIRAETEFLDELPEIRSVLIQGDSAQRKRTLQHILHERISLIMDDSFVNAFAACAKDSDDSVRAQVATIVGGQWVWSAKKQNPEAIELLLQLSTDSQRDVRYKTVYHGLSTIREKNEKVINRLLEIAFEDREPNLFGRIVWGLRGDRKAVKRILQKHIEGPDPQLSKQAEEVYKSLTGENYARE